MIILSFDSTAKIASCAVTDGERMLASYSINNGLTQSELLMPMAQNLLKCLGMKFDDIEVLACSVGPGSFTGVRIGAALVKGIAFARGIPCVAVSTIEALAENLTGCEGLIVPVMDARRNQTYTAIFKGTASGITRVCEDMAISYDELAAMLAQYPDLPIYLVGDGYDVAMRQLSKTLGARLAATPPALRDESAYSVARVASRLYADGKAVSDTELMPTYLRMPQAERERLERLKNEK